MSEYYTPDIEDIRVGYECEREETIEGYKPYTFDLQGVRDYIQFEISDYKDFFIKTPYLTKEQIEAEGFIFKGKGVDDWYEMGIEKAFNTNLHNFSGYKAYNVFLQYGKHDNRLKIRGDFSGGAKMNEGEVLFDGECKSINDLRQILKLIHITPFYKN